MTTNHPAHGPVSLDRLHQIREILSKAAAQSDGSNLGYAMADAVKVIDGAIARELVRREHAAWSQATFGDVGPVGPLKHLSKEALEAAAEPGDLSEWADMQFLLWDAQRRAGISDGEITAAMEEKLKVNIARQWPEPKDGEPRLHIKEQPAPVVPDEYRHLSELYHAQEKRLFKLAQRIKGPSFDKYAHSPSQAIDVLEAAIFGYSEDSCGAAMLKAANSPVTPDCWIPVSERMPDKLIPVMVMYADGEMWSAMWSGQFWDDGCTIPDPHAITHWREMPAAPKQEVKSALEHGMQRYAGAMQKLSEGDD
ncbi:DUF550 domain-containing protein [Citrobacter sp. Cf122]|nr:dATP/dGTP pyrophosphohydrolase domain-containing protein [Citrobacter sp. Cf122]MDM3156025.1 DUF550 domain-containing protein [Citrobacter sp. Cf122]